MAEEYNQMNISMTNEDIEKVEIMMKESFSDNRSAFMRRLVRIEWARRHSNATFTSSDGTSITIPQGEQQ